MQVEIEKIFVNLIKQSLNLPDNYGVDKDGNEIPCVTIKSQNIKLFNTPHIQITVSTASSNVFANRKENITLTENGQEILAERVCLNDQRVIQIDIYSKNNEARQRFWEVQACLSSTLCEQLQDKYQFRIGKISHAHNLSGLDGGSDINRYTIRFNCLEWQEKVTPIQWYSQFNTDVWDENFKFAEIHYTT